ncbi:MAG: Fe-S cluster assembly ATPase SufC, partial [Alphaproteobacteria bacterium]
AYWNYEDNMAFTERLIRHVIQEATGGLVIKRGEQTIDFGQPFPRRSMRDVILEHSGLDIDALRIVGEGINRIMRGPDKGVLLITHYERLFEHVRPDRVHVLQAGRITRSGDIELARELEREGYAEAAQ